MNECGSSQILSLHNIHLSEAEEYKCSASLHNLSITAGIPLFFNVSKHYWSTPKQKNILNIINKYAFLMYVCDFSCSSSTYSYNHRK